MALLIMLLGLLNYTYFFVISKFYYLQKLDMSAEFSSSKFIIGSILGLSMIVIISMIKIKPFAYAFLVLVITVQVIPAIILYQYSHNDLRVLFSPIVFFCLIALFSHIKIRFRSLNIPPNKTYKILIIFSFLTLLPFIIVYLPYIDLSNLILQNIYETRAAVAQNVDNLFTTYMYNILARYVFPTLLIIAIARKNWTIVLYSILAVVFLFLAGANKAIYFGLVLVLLFSFGTYFDKAKYFILFLGSVTILGLFEYFMNDSNFILMYSTRRLVFIPPIMDIIYFEFFDGRPIYWSESLLSKWIIYPYHLFHSYLIGEVYFGTKEWNSNNGIFSDGFMNFGMVGVLVNCLIVAPLISFFLHLNISPRLFGIFFLLFISIISSALSTVFLTYGLFFLIFYSQFLLKDTYLSL